MDTRRGPRWLPGFLKLADLKRSECYFLACEGNSEHIHFNKTANSYCVDCDKGPLCRLWFRGEHKSHTVLKVHKERAGVAIPVDDISNLVNIEGIQQYTRYRSRHVYLQSRPQHKDYRKAACAPSCLGGCGRAVEGSFCSLACKMKAVHEHEGPRDALLTLAVPSRNGGGETTASPVIPGRPYGGDYVAEPPSPLMERSQAESSWWSSWLSDDQSESSLEESSWLSSIFNSDDQSVSAQ